MKIKMPIPNFKKLNNYIRCLGVFDELENINLLHLA